MKRLLGILVFTLALQGATISTITCAGGVATVTVANALVASQGFEIVGSSVSTYNINGTAVAANSTSFTFNVTCNGSASGGAFQPAWQMFALSFTANPSGYTLASVFWLTTTTPVACPDCTSQITGITAAQLAAIQAGTTVEVIPPPIGLVASASPIQMQTQISSLYSAAQSSMAAGGITKYVGYCNNGISWSAPPCN